MNNSLYLKDFHKNTRKKLYNKYKFKRIKFYKNMVIKSKISSIKNC